MLTIKVIVDKGRPKFFINFQGTKMKQWWLLKIKHRNIQSILHAKMYPAKTRAGKRCNFSWPYITFSGTTHHPSPTNNWSTTKYKKLTKQCFLPPPHQFSTQSSQYQNWKAKKYSILMVLVPGLAVSESSTRILKFYVSTDSEHKLHKTGIKNWPPIGFSLQSSLLGTCSHNH